MRAASVPLPLPPLQSFPLLLEFVVGPPVIWLGVTLRTTRIRRTERSQFTTQSSVEALFHVSLGPRGPVHIGK